MLKFTNFDYKRLCIRVRLNRDSPNFLSVGSNLCCFKQWRAGKLPIKFFPEEKMQKSEERHVNNRIFICTYHLYTLLFTVNNACDKYLLLKYIYHDMKFFCMIIVDVLHIYLWVYEIYEFLKNYVNIVLVVTIKHIILPTQETPSECANFKMQYALKAFGKILEYKRKRRT